MRKEKQDAAFGRRSIMTSNNIVQKAIRFERPPRIPIWFFNRDKLDGDIYLYDLSLTTNLTNEWGYKWVTLGDGTMGQPDNPVVPEWNGLDTFRAPDAANPRRLAGLAAYRKAVGTRYRLAATGISGFNVYTFLRGFENSMTDFLLEPDLAGRLLDMIMDFETGLIEIAAREGFHGIHFSDDWGTQQGLMISPELWRQIFKPRYQRQFENAHKLGLHVWLHSCGNIAAILPDFNEIGVDVMNISQPNVVDLVEVGRKLKGKQCFMVPISYQTVSISGTPEEIRNEAKRLHSLLAAPEGGFIGYIEDYACMGMTEQNFQACVEAFRALG
jgi:uroporphyrinogen decarboxylase